MSIVFTFVQCRKYCTFALAESDFLTILHCPSCHHNRIAILNKLSLLSIWQLNIIPSSPSYLQQTAELFFFIPTDRSRSEQITSLHVATGNRVVSQLLSDWPIHVPKVGCANCVGFLQLRWFYGYVKVDVVWNMVFLLQILKRCWLLVWKWDLTTFKGFKSNNPWRNRSNSIFGSEGTQRNILPSLEISETPVIEQHKSKDMFPCVIDLDGFSQLIRTSSQKRTNLHLKVQSFTLTKTGFSGILCLNLSSGPVELGSTDNNWWWSSMITNWNVEPVLIKRILRASNDRSDVEGMCTWWIIVCVVADFDWYVHVDFLNFVKKLTFQIRFVFNCGIDSENVLNGCSCLDPVLSAEAHKRVETVLLEDFFL